MEYTNLDTASVHERVDGWMGDQKECEGGVRRRESEAEKVREARGNVSRDEEQGAGRISQDQKVVGCQVCVCEKRG
jgi:hypothetical protein